MLVAANAIRPIQAHDLQRSASWTVRFGREQSRAGIHHTVLTPTIHLHKHKHTLERNNKRWNSVRSLDWRQDSHQE